MASFTFSCGLSLNSRFNRQVPVKLGCSALVLTCASQANARQIRAHIAINNLPVPIRYYLSFNNFQSVFALVAAARPEGGRGHALSQGRATATVCPIFLLQSRR